MGVLNNLATSVQQQQAAAKPQTADQIYAAHTRADLQRYNEELAPLESLYASHLMGPQAEANRAGFLQSVNQGTDAAFNRARGRLTERRRQFGLGEDRNTQRSLQRSQQASKAQNSTQAARFYDQTVTDSL